MKSQPPMFITDQLIFCKGFESVLLTLWEVITPFIFTLGHAASQKRSATEVQSLIIVTGSRYNIKYLLTKD